MPDEAQLPLPPTTMERVKAHPQKDVHHLRIRQQLIDSAEDRLDTVVDEFAEVFALLKTYEKTVTIFGSARSTMDPWAYDIAYKVSARLAEEGYAVITGGGFGVMESANKGAYEAGGDSIGLNILLPKEQALNPYTTANFQFTHFFSRKVSMTLYDSAYIYFPGGFGTLDELMEIIVLVQTGKVPRVPIILVGELFWRSLDEFFKNVLLANRVIEENDTKIYTIVNEVEEVIDIVKGYAQPTE